MKPEKSKKPAKKTLYIDAEDEITGIIDKVLAQKEQIVAVVVPKRASVFSSAVNLKLLKRSADQASKKIVLITSNKSILPIAGLVGLHTASSLSSKPFVPSAPTDEDSAPTEAEEAVEVDNIPKEEPALEGEEIDALEVDNSPKEPEPKKKESFLSKLKKDKHGTKLKVPNFNKFRTLLIIGGLVFAGIIVFFWWALVIAPKAVVTVKGDTQTKDLSFAVKADVSVQQANLDENVVPSTKKEIKKTETASVPATGEKDNGNKASGTITMRNCSQSDGSINVPAGTGVSADGLTYITQSAVALEPSIFSGGGSCLSGSQDVSVIAQNAGTKYNIDATSYVVAGYSGVSATGSEMTGGTSDIVKVVSASDIENAKSKLSDKQTTAIEELKADLTAEGYVPIEDTFTSAEGSFVPTPAVDTESNQVTVSVQKTYSMLGVKKSDLKSLIEKLAYDNGIDKSKQAILNDGLDKAVFQLGVKDGNIQVINVNNQIIAGPQINRDELKREIAGKKRGAAEQLIAGRPGITEVRIDTSPFWNYSVPKNVDKIVIIIQENPAEQQSETQQNNATDEQQP